MAGGLGKRQDLRRHQSGKRRSAGNAAELHPRRALRAIDKAHEVQKAWARKTGKGARGVLRKLYDLMVANADDLAVILTMEMGKPLAEAKGEILYGASYVEWFGEEAKRVYGTTIPGHQADKRIIVIRQPVGVVGAITPWNFPNAMLARKMAPALAVGCTDRVQACRPDAAFGPVAGVLAERQGSGRCYSVFTGTEASMAADQIKKLGLELGGNAPFIVFDDADLDAAVEGAMVSKYRNAARPASAPTASTRRQYRPDDRQERAGQGAGACGRRRFQGCEDRRRRQAAGSRRPLLPADDPDRRDLGHDGGPRGNIRSVAPLFKFETEADVVAMANDTEFGLASYFYSKDVAKIFRVAEQLEYGMVGINTGLISTEVAPFGGIKQSGTGREGSKYGIEDYTELKYMCLGGIE
ncbi:hypothetical protein Lal_00013134 [Lupinus albus]|nr:hypothetical protein Lal_00013134 [Lupinus albus]